MVGRFRCWTDCGLYKQLQFGPVQAFGPTVWTVGSVAAETDKRQLQDVYAGISTDGNPRAITGAVETRHICSGLD